MKLFHEILLIIFSASIIVSCSGSKNLATEEKVTAVVNLPCAEKGTSDAEFFRACADATSSSISLAREKAIASAKSELGKTIIDKTIAIANRYASELGRNDKSAFLKEIELATNKAVDLTINGISIICENYSESNSRYTTYMVVEIEKQTVIDKICELATKDISNFDKIAFEKIFRN